MGNAVTTVLSDALFSKTRSGILRLLFLKLDRSFYLLEIVDELGLGRGTVQRDIEKLVSAGIVKRRSIGNQIHFQANPECLVFPELLGIVQKLYGLSAKVRKIVQKHKMASGVLLFGSQVSGQAKPESDLDVIIISDQPLLKLDAMISEIEGATGLPTNPTIYTPEEFRRRMDTGNHFLKAVLSGEREVIVDEEGYFGVLD